MPIPVFGCLLAAGESRRMGGFPKPLLPWGGSTVGRTILEQMARSKLDRVCAVVGHRADEVRAALACEALGSAAPGCDRTVEFIDSPNYRAGMLASIQSAAAHVAALGPCGLMIFLVDQPRITAEVVDALIDAFRAGDHGIVVPLHQGRRGHPIVIHSEYADEILALDPAVGLRQLMHRHVDDRLEVPVDSPAILGDMDTPDEYERQRPR